MATDYCNYICVRVHVYIVLEQTSLAEYNLIQAIEKNAVEKEFTEEAYDNDSPENITIPPTIEDESLIKDVISKLELALSHASGQEKEVSQIIGITIR